MKHALRLSIVPGYLVLCLLFGGASAAGYWGNMALQLLGLVIIFFALASEPPAPLSRPARQLMALLIAILAYVALELLPLPPALWSAFPGRGDIATQLAIAGQPLPWLPLSLDPYRTIGSALSLIPPIAVFLAMVRLGGFRALWIAVVIVAVAILSIFIGAAQVSGSDQSPFYFYAITNFGKAVGFFANSNHLGTLMVVSIPFLAAMVLRARARGTGVRQMSALWIAALAGLAVLLIGIAINRSLAAAGLTVPALILTAFVLPARSGRKAIIGTGLASLLFAAALAVIFIAPVGSDLFSNTPQPEGSSRSIFYGVTWHAARDFFPTGTGIGTFQQIYHRYEDPATVDQLYVNHAHNDYLELLLETGPVAWLFAAAFLFWLGAQMRRLWSGERGDELGRAAAIACLVMLVHSIVDYPLRTAALAATFAACCGLLADVRSSARRASNEEPADRARHLEAD
jgi:O-antigen ligase